MKVIKTKAGAGLRAPKARLLTLLFALGALIPLAVTASEQGPDWPQYRGPERHGVTGDQPVSDGAPRLLWRRPIGDGFSAVSAVGERLFTMGIVEHQGEPRDAVLALDAGSGEELWRVVLGEPVTTEFGDGPRSTPAVDDGRVFAISSRSLLVALDAESGEQLWRRDLLGEQTVPRFGYSSSPLVDGGQLIVEAGSPDPGQSVAALDVETGDVIWRALDGGPDYASPVAVEIGGVRQYVFIRRAGREVVSLSTSGEVLWRHGVDAMTMIPMPILAAPDLIFVSASDDAFGGLMLRVEVSEDEQGQKTFSVSEAWRERLMRNHFNTSVVVGGQIYGFDNATFKCLDVATGKRRWARRGFGKGSLIAAGDRLYVLGDGGTLAVVRATPEAYTEIARVEATTGKAWTAPSLQRGRLFLRDQDEIAAFELVQAEQDRVRTAEILARYAEARGGLEAWRSVDSMRLTGEYAAFSESAEFSLIRRRPALYKLDFTLLGVPAVRARDEQGPWMLHKLLAPQAAGVDEGPYRSQLERESLFTPELLDIDPARVRYVGEGDVDGRATLKLEVRFEREGPEEAVDAGPIETWHLDAETYLEVAVDSEVQDLTQLPGPMRQRLFFDDFRRVDGLMVPHLLEWEFGARLESMRVRGVEINPKLGDGAFSRP